MPGSLFSSWEEGYGGQPLCGALGGATVGEQRSRPAVVGSHIPGTG